MLLLLAGVFSLGGFVLVYVNSADMLRQAAAQAEQWHRMQYYTLETEVLGLMARVSLAPYEACGQMEWLSLIHISEPTRPY